MEEAVALGNKISTFSKPVVAMIKETINQSYNLSLEQGLLYEKRIFYQTFGTHDRKEGMTAFIEKRKPVFKDN